MAKTYSPSEVRKLLRATIASQGSRRQWAKEHGFSACFVTLVLQGKKLPSPRLLAPLGIEVETETIYRSVG